MFIKQLKKVISIALAFAIVLSLSCCGGDEVSIDEIGSETTETTTETTAETLSEEELDELVQNMPEIVFVLSYQNDNENNIFGYYVKNTGEVKMFDFREIAPDEIYDISDVYNRLEEVTYDGLYTRREYGKAFHKIISEDDLTSLSQIQLAEYYKRLLLIEGDAEYIEWGYILHSWGYYKFYGIKNNDNEEKECILLFGDGADSEYKHSNPDALNIYMEICSSFPSLRSSADW